jgi:hypothetical protein
MRWAADHYRTAGSGGVRHPIRTDPGRCIAPPNCWARLSGGCRQIGLGMGLANPSGLDQALILRSLTST